MAHIVLFRSGQPAVFLPSQNTSAFEADPDAVIHPDLSGLLVLAGNDIAQILVPFRYWKRVGQAVQEMLQGEKDTVDAAIQAAADAAAAAQNVAARSTATTAIDTAKSVELKLVRAIVELVKDEINVLFAAVPRLVSSITRTGTVATVTTPTVHGLSNGATVIIVGADVAIYNGSKTITVTTTTAFTYPGVSGSPVTPATGSIFYTLSANTPPLARTMAQAIAAVKNKITSGVVD